MCYIFSLTESHSWVIASHPGDDLESSVACSGLGLWAGGAASDHWRRLWRMTAAVTSLSMFSGHSPALCGVSSTVLQGSHMYFHDVVLRADVVQKVI